MKRAELEALRALRERAEADGAVAVVTSHVDPDSQKSAVELTVCDDTMDGLPGVVFEARWGQSRREFGFYDEDDIRAVARVLARAVGTELADEAGDEA
jgi:hypothetical protein